MTSPTPRAINTPAGWSGTNDAPAPPPGTAAGDCLLMFLSRDQGSAAPTISGWTHLYTNNTSNVFAFSQSVYWRVATASEPSTYPVDMGGAGGICVILGSSGADTTTPIQAFVPQLNTSGSSSVAIPSVTATTIDTLLVAFYAAEGVTLNPYSPDAAMTERFDYQKTGVLNSNFSGATQAIAAAGPTGTRTATANAAGNSFAMAILLAPAGAGPSSASNPPRRAFNQQILQH